MTDKNQLLRSLPSVDKLFRDPAFEHLNKLYAHDLLKKIVTKVLDGLRSRILCNTISAEYCTSEQIVREVKEAAYQALGPKLKKVINATGVIVHTNLGRSPLSEKVARRIAEIATVYSNLEYNLDLGKRGERNAHLKNLMKELTGAEAALAVNNNAAAVLLALSSLAPGKEVIVSRGELIEIGGSFRVPDVMKRSGSILKEVGTTNRTHPKDYREAINENTALILKVHTSNYRIVGFTREVELDELAEIGKEYYIPTMMDLGSGCLVDLSKFGLAEEVTVQAVLSKGIDVVSFSGDKLLGGPQAGILAGRSDLIETMRVNPLARALRMDKLTLAGLEATLEEYVSPEGPFDSIPTIQMISASPEQLQDSAEALANAVKAEVGSNIEVSIEKGVGRVGGGALPLSDLPGPRVAVRLRNMSAARVEAELRRGIPPVIVLTKDDAIMLDARGFRAGDSAIVPKLIASAISRSERS